MSFAWLVVIALVVLGLAGLLGGAWWLRGRIVLAGLAALALAVGLAALIVTRPAEALATDPHPDGSMRIAALGDSYISGEGAQRYFPGTDTSANDCHRAATAYPYLVADELGASLTFIACSGALTRDVLGPDPQHPDSAPDVFGGRPQLEDLRAGGRFDVVLLGIGGNDAGFAEIGEGCASPVAPDCRRSASYWLRRLDRDVYPALLSTYRAARAQAGDATVFVMTYPNPLGPRFCRDIGLSRAEMAFVRDVFIGRLNELIEYAAQVAQVRVIDLTRSLEGRRFCETSLRKAGVNFVQVGRTAGRTVHLDWGDLGSLAHGTFHPNPVGHGLLAKTVGAELEKYRDGRLEPLPEPPPTETPPPFVPPEIGPPVGPHPFPPDTRCRGDTLAFVSPVSVVEGTTELRLDELRPASTVCYRTFQAAWRSKRADASGAVRVPVDIGNAGVGGINEVLAEQAGGVWKKVVVSRLGEPGEFDAPDPPSNTGLYIVGFIAALGLLSAFVLHWIARRRR